MELRKFMLPVRESVIGHPEQKRELFGLTAIAFLEPDIPLRRDTVYVCAAGDFFGRRYYETPGFAELQAVFVCDAIQVPCGDTPDFDNVVFLSLCERRAFILLSARMRQYLDWERRFTQLHLSSATAQDMLNTAVSLSSCSFFLLNGGGQPLLSAPANGAGSLPDCEAFPCSDIEKYYRSEEQLGHGRRCVRLRQPFSGSTAILRRLSGGYHLLCVCPVSCTADIPQLCAYMDAPLCDALSRFPPPDARRRDFSLALGDVLEARLTDEYEIRQTLYPARADEKDLYYRLLLIDFTCPNPEPERFSELMRELSDGISDTEFVIYGGQLLGVSLIDLQEAFRSPSKKSFVFGKSIHRGENWLSGVMRSYDARIVIGETTSLFSRLRTVYLLAVNAIQIQRKVAFHGDPMYIYLPDFNLFNILDYAAKYFSQLHGHDDFIYLGRSEVSVLYHYDREKNTNLSLVLLNYLLCGKNLDKTAQAVYMHRNTVMNKLERIREITKLDLSNAYVQADVILSILLLMYKEKVMGREFDYELQTIKSRFYERKYAGSGRTE